MPIFEYQCADCERRFELLVLRSSERAKCPDCRSEKLTKLLSMFAPSSEQSRKQALRGARARRKEIEHAHSHEEHKRAHRHLDHDH